MPTFNKPADPITAPGAISDATATAAPASESQVQRWFSPRSWGRARQFAASLKANARWTKRFLHGSK